LREVKTNLKNNVELITGTSRIRCSKVHKESAGAVLAGELASGKGGRDIAHSRAVVRILDQNISTVNGRGSGGGISLEVGVGGGGIRRAATTDGSTWTPRSVTSQKRVTRHVATKKAYHVE
jgi:hypothetical protein